MIGLLGWNFEILSLIRLFLPNSRSSTHPLTHSPSLPDSFSPRTSLVLNFKAGRREPLTRDFFAHIANKDAAFEAACQTGAQELLASLIRQ